jgi:diguanylate cyclase (GGDEF)-like protein
MSRRPPDSEQTLADADHARRDNRRLSPQRDQSAADRDQAASDHDLAEGANPGAYEFSRDVRLRRARECAQSPNARLEIAAERDAAAQSRDRAARARDHAADARDRAMAELDVVNVEQDDARSVTGAEVVIGAEALRAGSAQYRARATEHRALAAEDRAAAARESELGARDRLSTLADLERLGRELAVAEIDALTGLRTRAAGLGDLERELDRCQRTSSLLTVAYVDVVGLKIVNDKRGHIAGDELLREVVACIRAHMRSYDVIIRFGGDEFVCAMPNMSLTGARERFSQIASALAAGPDVRAIRAGFATLRPDESSGELIARADGDIIDARR